MSDMGPRIAVLENEIKHAQRDLDEFFEYVRRHMDKEEKDRAELIALIGKIKTRGDIQTYFTSGVIATIGVLWTVFKEFNG